MLWLWSTKNFDSLFDVLQPMLYGELDNGKKVFCRYYDPRCTEALLIRFSANTETAQKLQNITAWAYWKDGQYQYLSTPKQNISSDSDQMSILASHTFEQYISELVAYCGKNFPHLNRTIPDKKRLRELLKACDAQAESDGFTLRGPSQFYIGMLLVYGIGLKTDPQYPWFKNILVEYAHFSELSVSTILYNKSEQYLSDIIGEQSAYMLAAIDKAAKLNLNNMPVRANNFTGDMLNLLKTTFPQKYQQDGEKALTELIIQGRQKAQTVYGFEQANQAALVILLMFIIGHQFDTDPFYAFAAPKRQTTDYYHQDGRFIMKPTEDTARKLERWAKIWLVASARTLWHTINHQQAMEDNDYGIE